MIELAADRFSNGFELEFVDREATLKLLMKLAVHFQFGEVSFSGIVFLLDS